MPIDLDPRRALSGGPQRVSLIRCRACQRADECSPATVMWLMQGGGQMCCSQPMDLFIQTTWPGVRSHAAPACAVPAASLAKEDAPPAAEVLTIAW